MAAARGDQPVMACVNNGDRPDAALTFATDLALRTGRPLRLIHIDADRQPRDGVLRQQPDLAALEAAVRYALSGGWLPQRERNEPILEWERVRRAGAVRDDLVRLAAAASTVVIMRRSLSHVHRILVGSVSDHLAVHAPVPVVVVPEFWASWGQAQPRVMVVIRSMSGARSSYAAAVQSLTRGAVVDEITATRSRFLRSTDLIEASRHADLLVIDRPGFGRLDRRGRELLRLAHCPVAIVPSSAPSALSALAGLVGLTVEGPMPLFGGSGCA